MWIKLILGLFFSTYGLISQHGTARSTRSQVIGRWQLVLLAGVAPAFVLLAAEGNPWQLAAEFIFALGFSLAAAERLKNSIERLRPYAADMPTWSLTEDARRSFPSAHAALATAGLGYMAIRVPGFTWIAIALMGFIGLTRVLDKMHNVSDVVAGHIIGCVALVFAAT